MEMPAEVCDAMVAHARFCYPEEACGLLACDPEGRVRMVYALTNAEHSPVAYTVDPAEHLNAMRHAERNGWELAGVFHSHTHSPAYPSPTDVARAVEPGWVYVLVSLEDAECPEVRAFRIEDGNIVEEPLRDGGPGEGSR
jgi:proteasome lid subunit RPN8/RPN11